MFLPNQPFFDGEKSGFSDRARAVEGGGGIDRSRTRRGGRSVNLVIRNGCCQRHALIVRYLKKKNQYMHHVSKPNPIKEQTSEEVR